LTIEFRCPHCQKVLTTTDDKAAHRARCPQCSEPVTVPISDKKTALNGSDIFEELDSRLRQGDLIRAETIIACPMCGDAIQANAIKCKHCGETLPFSGKNQNWIPRMINASEVFSKSQALYQKNWGMCIGTSLLAYCFSALAILAVCIVFAGLGTLLIAGKGLDISETMFLFVTLLLSVGLLLAISIVSSFFQLGAQSILLQIARGQQPQINQIFSGGPFLWRMFLCATWFWIMIMVGYVCLVIPAIIVALIHWPYSYVLIDRNLPGLHSVSEARKITKGNLLSLLQVSLPLVGVALIGIGLRVGLITAFFEQVLILSSVVSFILTSGIVLVVVVFFLPFCMLVMAVAYSELTRL